MKMHSTLKVPYCITKCALAIIYSNSFSQCKVDQKKTVAISQMFNYVQLHVHWMHLLNVGGRVVQWCWAKFPVPGRPAYLDKSRARAFCACSRCGWGLFRHFFSRLSFLFLSPSLWETARYRLKYCLNGPLSPKQPNQTKHLLNTRICRYTCIYITPTVQTLHYCPTGA